MLPKYIKNILKLLIYIKKRFKYNETSHKYIFKNDFAGQYILKIFKYKVHIICYAMYYLICLIQKTKNNKRFFLSVYFCRLLWTDRQ